MSGIDTRRLILRITLLCAVFAAAAIVWVAPSRGQTPSTTGYRDFSWSYPNVQEPTADKMQSKLWYNDGVWWGDLFSATASAWHIYRFDWSRQSWSDTGTAVDDRPDTLPDCLWDGSHLYVASGGSTQEGLLYRFSYNPSSQNYSLDPGFPADMHMGTGTTAPVIDRDSSGKLWVTYVQNSSLMVNRTIGTDSDWGTPFVPAVQGTGLASDDVSSLVAFNGRIGVMWSNQRQNAMYFSTHVDGTGDGAWTPTETALAGTADRHINLKQLNGEVFAAVKTSYDDGPHPNPAAPLIMLLVRGPTGTWSSYTYGTVADALTRPIVLIDRQNNELYVVVTARIGGGNISTGDALTAIYYKRAPLADISFPSGRGTRFIRNGTDQHITDSTSTKQNLDDSTGLLVEGIDTGTHYYLHGALTLEAPPPTATRTAAPTPTAMTDTGGWPVKTVFVVLLENRDWSRVKGKASAPYINRTLLPSFAHAEHYVTPYHPSLPNYLTLEAGSNLGVTGSPEPTAKRFRTPLHLTSLLRRQGLPWKAYYSVLPGNGRVCPLTDRTRGYSADHNPFVYFDDVSGNSPRSNNKYCIQHIRPARELFRDLSSNHVARYNVIVPSDYQQGEKLLPGSQSTLRQADDYLKTTLPKIEASRAYRQGGVIFVVWDEPGYEGHKPSGMIVVSPWARKGYSNSIPYSHPSLLRTVEEIFNLHPLLRQAAHVRDLRNLFVGFP